MPIAPASGLSLNPLGFSLPDACAAQEVPATRKLWEPPKEFVGFLFGRRCHLRRKNFRNSSLNMIVVTLLLVFGTIESLSITLSLCRFAKSRSVYHGQA